MADKHDAEAEKVFQEVLERGNLREAAARNIPNSVAADMVLYPIAEALRRTEENRGDALGRMLGEALGLTPYSGGYYWGNPSGELFVCVRPGDGAAPWIFSKEGIERAVLYLRSIDP